MDEFEKEWYNPKTHTTKKKPDRSFHLRHSQMLLADNAALRQFQNLNANIPTQVWIWLCQNMNFKNIVEHVSTSIIADDLDCTPSRVSNAIKILIQLHHIVHTPDSPVLGPKDKEFMVNPYYQSKGNTEHKNKALISKRKMWGQYISEFHNDPTLIEKRDHLLN